jgi:L-ascorbate metabolism protein UlaG (beta-lactamase superfamily)
MMREYKGTEITWLGHATVLIRTTQGTTILIDPFIHHNPKYPKGYKLPETIDYILLTHGHGDHIADVVEIAEKHNSTVIAIYELAAWVASKGVKKSIGMNLGGTIHMNEVSAVMVEAKHSSSVEDDHGVYYAGDAVGYVLSVKDGSVIYHAGDTAVFGDMRLIHELYEPTLAILPIGGHFTMGPKEAAMAVKLIQPKHVLPIHFGTTPQLTGTPLELSSLLDEGVEVIRCLPGETIVRN